MPELKTVVLGDRAVQVADSDVLAIEQFKTDMNKRLGDAESSKNAMEAKKDEEIGELKAKVKKAEDAAASFDIDALVSARTELLGQVKAVDASIVTTGKSDADLRKAAVVAKMGDAAIVGCNDAEISGMFKVIAKDAQGTTNPAAAVFKQGVQRVGDASAMADAALAKANDMNAWRNAQ